MAHFHLIKVNRPWSIIRDSRVAEAEVTRKVLEKKLLLHQKWLLLLQMAIVIPVYSEQNPE